MRMNPLLVLIFVATALCTGLVAQAQTDARTRGATQNIDRTFYPPKESQITGVVVDANGAPIANALVKVLKKDSRILVGRTQTEADGRFVLEIKAKGTFVVVCSADDFQAHEFAYTTEPKVVELHPVAATAVVAGGN